MTNFDATLLYPVRDSYARRQFLFASLIMLANAVVPFLPMLILMGYVARIMRQIIQEGKEPSMIEWQGSNWGELLKEGVRIFAVQVVYGLPIWILIIFICMFMLGFPFALSSLFDADSNLVQVISWISVAIGIGILLLTIVLSLPLGLIIGAAVSHAVAGQSFRASLQIREWWPIFRASMNAFLGAFFFTIAAGFIMNLVTQIAMITIILICVVPFVMLGYSTYILLVRNALFAQAYAAGQKAIQKVTDANS